ncbi:MAG: RtcB family protein [Chitinophagales bacterium]
MKLGFQESRVVGILLNAMKKHFKYKSKNEKLEMAADLLANPKNYKTDEAFAVVAKELLQEENVRAGKIAEQGEIPLRKDALDFNIYGKKQIEKSAIQQMYTAMKLPITLSGALMPDAHQGYGLPIGGVLATDNAVIPYGVGVDIGCRMCLTLYDLPNNFIKRYHTNLKKYLVDNTRFGMGCEFDAPMDDEIFEDKVFQEVEFVRKLKHRAYKQIGTSGGGNHFVEFGMVEILTEKNEWHLPIGQYIAILSHSGSRGLGAKIANHYTKLARQECPLPREAQHLAWLDLDTELGQEYWMAMNLAGDYASACHHQIHKRLAKAIGEKPIAIVENHHNFAWKEKLADGTNVIVHRKGATPAGKGVLGIIPGSMTAPGFIVRGKGKFDSINSASHGAGRQMSRRKAKNSLTKSDVRKYLRQQDVTLIGGGLDEAPMAYKDIHEVMRSQQDLVEVLGTFKPKIVRMSADND